MSISIIIEIRGRFWYNNIIYGQMHTRKEHTDGIRLEEESKTMDSSVNIQLLRLLGWEGAELERFLPEWERAARFLRLSDEDVYYSVNQWLPKYWDISLLSVRKLIAAFVREAAELSKMEQYKSEGKAILSSHNTSSFVCLYANKLAGKDRIHVVYPDFIMSTMWQAFFGKPLERTSDGASMNYGCGHCALNCTKANGRVEGFIPEPTVSWSWGLHCDEAPKTEELIARLKNQKEPKNVLVYVPHDAALGEVEADNDRRVAYLASKMRDSQRVISRYTGVAVTDEDMRAAQEAYMAYMRRVEKITDLVVNADPQPISGNELALFSVCMQVCFDTGMEAVNEALDIAITEIEERIAGGLGPLPKGAPKLACYFVPLNVPWVDRLFRDNGVNLSLGRVFPIASMMEKKLDADDPYMAAARQCFMCPDTVNMKDAARIVADLLGRYPIDGALLGFYDFDRWIGALQKTEMRLVEEATEIPHYYLEGDFWAGDKYSTEDRTAVIRGICNCLKISGI